MKAKLTLIPVGRIDQLIFLIRGHRVMLDRDLAQLYSVETRVLNQAVRRNIDRFPADFIFELTREEIRNISQIVISSGLKHAPKMFAVCERNLHRGRSACAYGAHSGASVRALRGSGLFARDDGEDSPACSWGWTAFQDRAFGRVCAR